ncbi:carboxypeptidase-like regulatory domain-containing protein [Bremerella alba]|uniref:Carboxypeptidase regulatory-like domain-containing protein n=1 Tax=Bremerella alba TaxID=980252 RepID=A0A7V8V0U0_9BACT|nr:carboxypeptidase-like regulatory domain-containing protein [Bremerella alba]MBA2112873.1 hypothetical protein [Bremerella alba]
MTIQSLLGFAMFNRLFLIICVCLCISGCGYGTGDGLGSVSGTVSLDGEPVPQVVVTFTPSTGGRESYGITDASGNYQLRYTSRELGAKTGEHEVRVSPMEVEPREPVTTATSIIPIHYYGNDFLIYEVSPGSNQIDLELSTTPVPDAG